MSVTALSSQLPRRAKVTISALLLGILAAFAMIVAAAAGATHELLVPAASVLAVLTFLAVGVFPGSVSLYEYVTA